MTYLAKGTIDFFKDGFLNGWLLVTAKLEEPNKCDLWIDEQYITEIDATLYREDLNDISTRTGFVGFSIAIPLYFCDNKIHEVSLVKCNSNVVIETKNIKFQENKNLLKLDENIVFNKINSHYTNHKKVLFLAGFSCDISLLSYQKNLVTSFQLAGFYVVYTLASDNPELLLDVLNTADRMIVRRNVGYDFGSWAVALQMCHKEFFEAQEIVFANDSIIGPIGSMNGLFEKIDSSSAKMFAITDSQDICYHFQSYFWGIKKKSQQFFPEIDEFFFYRHALPKDKDEAIERYELAAFRFFKNKKLRIHILFPECDLLELAEKMFITNLQLDRDKWKYLFDLPYDKKEMYALNKGKFYFFNVFSNRLPTNPSHCYWNALVESGFPFVKRELITLNPINYPFSHEFRAIFEKYDAIHLLDDLPSSVKLNCIF